MSVQAIPAGFSAITPYLIVDNPAVLIAFVEAAFGGTLHYKMTMPGTDNIMHAEMSIAGAKLMLGRSSPQHPALPAMLYLYLPNVDETLAKAVAAGATLIMPAANMFYGDRSGAVKDSNGIFWSIATHIEDLSPEELKERAAAAFKK